MKLFQIVIATAAVVLLAACGQQASEPTAEQTGQPSPETPETTTIEVVSVSSDGTEFDPPVQPEQIPEGAWYCDMGTVHYAQMVEGDAKCPVCGMNLVHRSADAGTDEGQMHDEGMHDEGMHEEGGEAHG